MNWRTQILLAGIALVGAWKPAWAQGNALQLVRVEFWAPQDKSDHWVRIKQDGLSHTELSGPTKTKAWMLNNAGGADKKPVAYAGGATPRAGACFRALGSNKSCPVGAEGGPAPAPTPYFVRGTVLGPSGQPAAMAFRPKQLVKTGTADVYEYRPEPADAAFPALRVQYMEQFRIRWEWSVSGDPHGAWTQAGISENRMYVTYKKPLHAGPFFYTCLHLGCSEAANQQAEGTVVAGVFDRFKTRCVVRVDDAENNCLRYWGDPDLTRQNRGLDFLLENAAGAAYEDGRCGEWSAFFEEILAAQGISGSQVTALAYDPAGPMVARFDDDLRNAYLAHVEQFFGNDLFPTPNHPEQPTNVLLDNIDPVFGLPGTGARIILHGKIATSQSSGMTKLVIISQFFVKDWDFSQGEEQFYAALPTGQSLSIKNPNGQEVAVVTGADALGSPAQGNSDPRSNFDDHVLFQHGNLYYDPSYGTGPFPDKAEWVVNSLAGYGTLLIYLNTNNVPFYLIYLHNKQYQFDQNIIKFTK